MATIQTRNTTFSNVTGTQTFNISLSSSEQGQYTYVNGLRFSCYITKSDNNNYTVSIVKIEGSAYSRNATRSEAKFSWSTDPTTSALSGSTAAGESIKSWSSLSTTTQKASTTYLSSVGYSTMASFAVGTNKIYVGDTMYNGTKLCGMKLIGTFKLTDPYNSSLYDKYYFTIQVYFRFSGTQTPTYTLTFKDDLGSYTGTTTWDTTNKRAIYTIPSIRVPGGSSTYVPETNTVYFYDGAQQVGTGSITRQNTVTTSYKAPAVWTKVGGGSATPRETIAISGNWSYTASCTKTTGITAYGQWKPSFITCPNPIKTGYSFKGWYTATSGGSLVASGGGTYVPKSKEDKLYAQWTPYILTINYESNGGTSTPSSQTVAYNSSINLRSAINKADDKNTNINWSVVLDCKGNVDEIIGENPNEQQIYLATTATETKKYSFKAWSYLGTEYGAGKSFKNEISQNGDTSIILSAIWSEPTISYLANNSVSLPTLKDIVGYTFDGWYTAKTGGSKLSNTYTPTANNTILYARWIPIERSLVTKYYNTASGSIKTDTIKYTIQDNPFYVNAPENEWGGDSYVFLGWSGGTESDKADDKWTQSNRGVFPVPANAPSYKYPLLITPRNLDTYVQWGTYDYQKGKYTTTGVTNYWFGCWTASGKYVKIIDEKTGQISWKKVIEAFVKVKGKWVPVTEMWAKINGEWRKEIGR